MRILLTNDDGILAPGLVALERVARELAGADGEVWVVAPATEQSGTAHCASFVHPVHVVQQPGERRYAIEGTPADCVLVGLHDILESAPPDLVLVGVNQGNNSGENIIYSGTVGAAMEAAQQDVQAIALSQYFGPDNRALDNPFEAAEAHGASVVDSVLRCRAWRDGDRAVFFNVNFPPCPADRVAGVKSVRQGVRQGTRCRIQPLRSPSGRRFSWIVGADQRAPAAPNTDVYENLRGYVSVTPLRADLTDEHVLEWMVKDES